MTVRKIRPNPWSVTGFIPSQKKQERSCDFESRLERDYAILVEFDPAVASYAEQPLTVFYRAASGLNVRGVPDFLVHFVPKVARRPLLVDVKYRSDLFRNWKKLKPRLRAARLHAKRERWQYKILTEIEIDTPYLTNARFLLPYRQQIACDSSTTCRVFDLLTHPDVTTPATLLKAHSSDRMEQLEILQVLWHLVSLHVVVVLPVHGTLGSACEAWLRAA